MRWIKEAHAHVLNKWCRTQENPNYVSVFALFWSLMLSLWQPPSSWEWMFNIPSLQRMKWKTEGASALVRMSACCSLLLIGKSLIIPCWTFSLTTWQSISMCFFVHETQGSWQFEMLINCHKTIMLVECAEREDLLEDTITIAIHTSLKRELYTLLLKSSLKRCSAS